MTGIGDDIKQAYVGGICLCVCVLLISARRVGVYVCVTAYRYLKQNGGAHNHRACINYCQQSHLMINHRSYYELNVY